MSEKVLFVDDEPNVLDGIRRQLRKKFDVSTAVGGEAALALIDSEGPFAIVVSDMKMPGMNGAEFLTRVRRAHPQSIRMILSGQSELDAAISAVNEGNIFRFMTKPCATDDLIRSLETAIDQYRLRQAEKMLLEQTLSGAVKVLTEILGLINPEAFSRASRIQQYAESVSAKLGLQDVWQLRLAAMLSQIGCISLPTDTLSKIYSGAEVGEDDMQMFRSHPEVAGKLLSDIPRLEEVAQMVAGEMEPVDLSTLPKDPREWDLPLLGSQILRAAIEFDRRLSGGTPRAEAIERMRAPEAAFPDDLVNALEEAKPAGGEMFPRTISMDELTAHMVFDQDIKTKAGLLLVPKGEKVTFPMLARLRNFARGTGIEEPFRVLVPR